MTLDVAALQVPSQEEVQRAKASEASLLQELADARRMLQDEQRQRWELLSLLWKLHVSCLFLL